jgi:hypothetical protein
MVRGIANSKIGFGDLILLLRYFFKLKVSTHPNESCPSTTYIKIMLKLQNLYLFKKTYLTRITDKKTA